MTHNLNNQPLYYQLVELLKNQIETHLLANDKLPSERELEKKYGVSRTTVRLALQELENERYIYRRHGKGTFVSDLTKQTANLAGVYSFTEEMKKIGKKPQTKVFSFEQEEADKRLARALQLSLGESVFKVTRLRLAD